MTSRGQGVPLLALFAALAIATLLCAWPARAEILVADDFEYFPANSGIHTVSPPGGTGAPLTTVWDQVVYAHKAGAIQIICDGTAASGNCYLAENFIPGGQGSSELRDSAHKAPTTWTSPSEEAWIRHFVRWPRGWQWPRQFTSLKLGRLRVAEPCRPGGPCIETYWGPMHGDPTRIMWTYAYTLDGTSSCCPSNKVAGRWPGGFQTDRWYCIELYVRQNTRLAPPDGVMELYVDGIRVGANHLADTRGNSGRGGFAWITFNITDNFAGFGGNHRNAAATETTPAVHFDGVVFGTTRVGCPSAGPPAARPSQ